MLQPLPGTGSTSEIGFHQHEYRRAAIISAAGLVLLAVTIITVGHLLRLPVPSPSNPSAMRLPDNPSIAVLPFTNLSGDRQQEYFSDGITEDLLVALARVPHLFVSDRNSTFAYKGKAPKVQNVSRELGVKYILEAALEKPTAVCASMLNW